MFAAMAFVPPVTAGGLEPGCLGDGHTPACKGSTEGPAVLAQLCSHSFSFPIKSSSPHPWSFPTSILAILCPVLLGRVSSCGG